MIRLIRTGATLALGFSLGLTGAGCGNSTAEPETDATGAGGAAITAEPGQTAIPDPTADATGAEAPAAGSTELPVDQAPSEPGTGP